VEIKIFSILIVGSESFTGIGFFNKVISSIPTILSLSTKTKIMVQENVLPSISETYMLSPDQLASFRANGHILLPSVASADEIEVYRPVINRAAYQFNTEHRKLEERDTYGKAFLQITNLWEVDDAVKRFTLAGRFARIAAQLLGVEKVRIYHDQALYKEPGGGHTPWHQDQYYWPLDTDKTVTMWMPLVNISKDMGMLTFASGSHAKGFVENVPISDKSDEVLQHYIESSGYEVIAPESMNAGDATWHYGWTLHSAPRNASSSITREVFTIIYYADGARLTGSKNPHQEADRQRWFNGLPEGSLVASSLNPVL
jgi:ectoine hydroxylase-related dioxygenase (phytanoyl-CoA dioxygenase family)